MTSSVSPVGVLTAPQVGTAMRAATADPWPRNGQPARFHCTRTGIELFADPARHDLLLACGAALYNLCVTIRAQGAYPVVTYPTGTGRPDLMAVVRPTARHAPTPAEKALASAVHDQRTTPRPARTPTALENLPGQLRRAARAEQAWLVAVPVDQLGDLPEPRRPWAADAVVMVVGSLGDRSPARLRAGQATQRVVLTAATAGCSASWLSQVTQVPQVRARLRDMIGGALWPQAVLSFGCDDGLDAAGES